MPYKKRGQKLRGFWFLGSTRLGKYLRKITKFWKWWWEDFNLEVK